MKSSRLIGLGVMVLASFAWGTAQHDRGARGDPMGGGAGSSGKGGSDHGAPASRQPEKLSSEQLLNQNTKLASHLQKLLPAGTTPQQACSGFKNLGQCVAAIHVSHNLGISFLDLKAKMMGSKHESLGKAIQSSESGSECPCREEES